MTDFPDWVRNTPSTPAIHNEPPQNYQWQNLTSDQLASLRKNLVDSIIQVVVSLVRGILLPGDPGTQLQDWAEDVPGFDQLISIFGGSGSGSTGFGNVIADFLGILGDPSGLGSGTPTLPGVNSIPLLAPLQSLIDGIIGGSNNPISALISALTGTASTASTNTTNIQSVVDKIYQAINGGTSTGNTLASVKASLQAIPGGNIVGSLAVGLIPPLPTSQITSGTFLDSIVPGLGTLMDGLFNGFTGGSAHGADQSAVNTVTATQTTTVGNQGAMIAQLLAGIGAPGGTADSDNFERSGAVTPNWTFLASSGTGTLDGHNFHYSGTGSSAEYVMRKSNLASAIDHMTSVVVTNQAAPGALFSVPPYGSYIDVWVRCTAFTTYATRSGVRLRVLSGVTASWSLDNIVSGVATNLQTGSCPLIGTGAILSLEAGAGGTPRRYLGTLNGSTIGCDFTDVSTTTIGASNRYRGFGGKGNSGLGIPTSVGVADMQQWTGT